MSRLTDPQRPPLVYLAHPVRAPIKMGVVLNLQRAKRWLEWAALSLPRVYPIAPWISWCEIMDDAIPAMRELGLACDLAVIERCHELWLVGGRISVGMAEEARHAEFNGLRVRDMTGLGEEPPELIDGVRSGR